MVSRSNKILATAFTVSLASVGTGMIYYWGNINAATKPYVLEATRALSSQLRSGDRNIAQDVSFVNSVPVSQVLRHPGRNASDAVGQIFSRKGGYQTTNSYGQLLQHELRNKGLDKGNSVVNDKELQGNIFVLGPLALWMGAMVVEFGREASRQAKKKRAEAASAANAPAT